MTLRALGLHTLVILRCAGPAVSSRDRAVTPAAWRAAVRSLSPRSPRNPSRVGLQHERLPVAAGVVGDTSRRLLRGASTGAGVHGNVPLRFTEQQATEPGGDGGGGRWSGRRRSSMSDPSKRWNRREFVGGLTLAGTAGCFGIRPEPVAAEPPCLAGLRARGGPALLRFAPARGRIHQVEPQEADRRGCGLAHPQRAAQRAEGIARRPT